MPFKIANRNISDDHNPLVIVEIGINHEGSIKTAFEMVDAAYKAGAEVIKHQTHIIEDEMSQEAKNVIPGNAKESIYEIMQRCALNEEEELALKDYVEEKGMIFISTPFSRKAADRLEKMNVPAYKIGSGECNNHPLLKHIASFGKPMIVSTGMNDMTSVRKTANILKESKVDFAFLHTTNLYPTPPSLVRLGAMSELMNEFQGIEVGLSDHTTSNHACFAAVALGANILERHFTDDMKRPGPDIVNSMDPKSLEELISGSSLISKMRGGTKQAAKEEQSTINFAFATVITTKKIKEGEVFSKDNIWVKRPGLGEISAEDYESLFGKKCNKDLEPDFHIQWSDVDDA